jgi:N-acetylglutamate synthase-like GNAT family acetyltransferase
MAGFLYVCWQLAGGLRDFLKTDFMTSVGRVTLHPVKASDEEFLNLLYASTRIDEMALVDWSEEQKAAFLKMQFDAQTSHYRLHYPSAEYQIIQQEKTPIGRLIIERSQKSLLLMDIALLPEYRNAGIGTSIVKDLMEEARQVVLPLVLRVEFFNPVIRLYARLGFTKTREVNSVYHEMVWTP